MLRTISNSIVTMLLEKSLISQADRELYCYGAEMIIIYIISFFTTILIGILFNVFAESIIFYFSYLFIRVYVGGYHASTYRVCYIISLFITVIALIIISRYSYVINTTLSLLSMISIGIFLNFIGPIEDRNKKLTEDETKEYHNKIKIILCIEIAITAAMYMLRLNRYAFTIFVAWVIMLTMAFAGIMRNKITRG